VSHGAHGLRTTSATPAKSGVEQGLLHESSAAMKLYKHLVIATDLSDHATEGVRAGARLARQLGARVTLVHVFDPGPFELSGFPAALDELRHEQARSTRDALEALRRAELTGVVCEIEALARPGAADAVATLARESGADLCVLGTHGRTGIRRMLLGSVAERVVRHAPCDVLVARPRHGEEAIPELLVAGTDLSEGAGTALERALEQAKQLGAELHVVHVFDDGQLVPAEDGRSFVPAARWKERLEDRLAALRAEHVGRYERVVTRVVTGHDAAETLCRYAADHHAGLVVVGTHGRTGIARMLIGSVAERTVRLAPCSVLVVR
jgi:nucleotide-binding universal stress UspA family protein